MVTHIAASRNPGFLAACRALSAAIQRSARFPVQRVVMRSTGEARLLVIDDEETILELLSGSLRLAGFEVTTATASASVSPAWNSTKTAMKSGGTAPSSR
jgi:PleD family two-component response regulator